SPGPHNAYAVAASGDLAFVADADLQIIDISDPSNPVLAGSYDTPDQARGVAVSGNLAFVADDHSGLQIIDISNPSSPVLAGSYDTPDRAFDVAVSGDLAFVADWESGLQVIAHGQSMLGNISADPLFCDPDNADFTLAESSQCSPAGNPSCGLIGARPVGCALHSMLVNGVFIAHYVPELAYTEAPDDACGDYDQYAITAAEDQLTRIDNDGTLSTWFVLAAWNGEREFCGTEFGLADFDPDIYAFYGYDACFPVQGLQLPTGNWPGPVEGIALVATGTPWSGNFVPVYYFTGYAYSGETVIPLGIDPDPSKLFGGFANCAPAPEAWHAICFGAMGINTPGAECDPNDPPPEYACCMGEACQLLTLEECLDAGGQWRFGIDSCNPNPCLEYACCIGEECQVLTLEECTLYGGEWQVGVDSCNPNPCMWRACCIGDACQVLPFEECNSVGGEMQWGIDSCDPNPCWVRADFTADITEGWPPLLVSFTDLSENGPTSWEWDLDGNGTVNTTIQHPTFEYTEPDLYSVTLTVATAAASDTLTKHNFICIFSDNNMIVRTTDIVQMEPTPVPIEFIGSDSLGVISLYFDYNATKLTYSGIETYVPGETFTGGVVGEQITVQWFDETGGLDPIVPGVDPDTLFAILVTPVVAADTTQITFDEAYCGLGDRHGNPISDVRWVDVYPYGMIYIDVGVIVSGRVGYYWLDGPVPGAWLSMGPPNPDVGTDAGGEYAFDSYPQGNYTLSISKSDDLGGINSIDALKVIRHSTGLELLDDPYKERAADVTGDDQINAFDAIKIVRAAVGLEMLPSGDWAFDPDSVVFEPLEHNVEADFIAIRMGDVNGDWE
ncbi:MAG: hypothetical protein KAY24_19610, partial [Candidatus Eisenbacteria sp.]|nr:hypothetical protein [Candidatus Eisenbacteria bacterium]